MFCRRNIRKLIEEFQAAPPQDRPATELIRYRDALVAMKAAPSRLSAPHTQANRYDDYVYVHQQSMAGHSGNGPHPGHRGPAFLPWHREFLRQFELDLRDASGDDTLCLPYWNFNEDQDSGDAGFPFIDDFLGGDGTGAGNAVETGVFAEASGWVLNINDDPGTALTRNFGQSGAPTLPAPQQLTDTLAETTYDSAPWNLTSSASSSFRNRLEGWDPALTMHNRVHVWVGGSMLPSTSPNDPVFFLNHTREDNLWAVWMQKHPTVDHYLPADSEPLPPGHTHLVRLSDQMDSLAEYFGGTTIDRPVDLLDHKAITWYDTDLPDIVLESGPAVAFNDTPAGLTVAKIIRFRVESCRPVTFSITGAPSGNFSVIGGPDFLVQPQESNDSETLEIEVRFHAIGADVQVSALDVEARITDEEGYYAANPGDPFVVERFHIELVANNIVTSDSSIVLVLDRSGSMADIASSGFTKNELLESAVGVVHQLMKPTDEIGIARFSNQADVLLPMTVQSAGLGTVLTGGGLDPSGGTSIGAGLVVGSGLINGPAATKPNKAMVVLSDGNENVAPLIADLPQGTINQTTFAIGFGQPGQVSDPVLSEISANTGGYLLVTGDMSDDDERFLLAKYFIQILKDATLNQTVVDPQGVLLWDAPAQRIPFRVAETEVSLDAVLLCPIPIAVDFRLVTPGGQVVTPQVAAAEPNINHTMADDLAFYRLLLPALPSQPAGSHRGTWKALLRLKSPGEIQEDLRNIKDQEKVLDIIRRLREFLRKPVPYTFSVYAYSNLALKASAVQSSFAPGATVSLSAALTEYQVPFQGDATVWATLTAPSGSTSRIDFTPAGAGTYAASHVTTSPGVYRFLIQAEGYTSRNARFTRETNVSAGVWAGGGRPYDPQTGGDGDGDGDKLCHILHCLFEQAQHSDVLRGKLKELGIDMEALRKCLAAVCRKDRGISIGTDTVDTLPAPPGTLPPELRRLLTAALGTGLTGLPLLESAGATPVKRVPKQKGSSGNMFVLPGQVEPPPPKKAPKKK